MADRSSGDGRGAESFGRLVAVALVALAVIAGAVALAVTRSDDRAALVRAEAAANPSTTISTDRADASTTSPSEDDAASAATQPAPPASFTMAFAGDLLPHGPVNARAEQYGAVAGQPYDYAPMLAPMLPIVGDADLAICHMEVPVAPPGEAVTSYPSFGAPAELVDGAKSVGYDGCSSASNHSLDRGQDGIAATLDRFDQEELGHAGTARSEVEANTTTFYEAQGAKVAHLSYAYDFNGYRIPDDAPWSVNQIDPDRIRADAARARTEGADLVVVSLHWGNEYDHEPSAYQRDIADRILPSPDIDLVIGHHAHVVQPIDEVEGTYVVWGLGNQLSNQTQAPRRDGLTVVATATRDGGTWRFSGIRAVPTYVDLSTFEVLPVAEKLAEPDLAPALRQELSDSYDRTVGVLFGGKAPGLTFDPKP